MYRAAFFRARLSGVPALFAHGWAFFCWTIASPDRVVGVGCVFLFFALLALGGSPVDR